MELDLYDASYPPWLWGPPATDATAGAPGVYAPDDAKRPTDLADLADVVADPLTAWEPGQYVLTREGSAYWDGAAWVAGVSGAGFARTAAAAPGGPITAGPQGYVTAVRPTDRPRNLQELAQRVQLEDPQPWAAGVSVPMGTRGKVAHWTGTEWKGGISPGYAAPQPAGPATQQMPVIPPPPPAAGQSMTTQNMGTQFPGDGNEQPGDLSR